MNKKVGLGFLVLCVFFLTFFTGNVMAAQKVLILSGTSEDAAQKIGTTMMVIDGIKEVLAKENVVPEMQWIDLDGQKSPGKKAELGLKAIEKARQAKPDVIIVLNNDALKYVGAKIDDIPVVFAWVFSTDMKSLGLPKPNITGVTRRSYAPDIWALARRLTGIKTVALMSKNGASMAGVRKYLFAGADKLEKLSGVRFMEMYLCDTFEEWESQVKNFPADLIYLADTSRIQKGDRVLSTSEIVKWTVENSKVPVIAANAKDAEDGALFSIVTSEMAIGNQAATIAQNILSGTPVSEIPIQPSSKGKLIINAKTAQKYNIEIPNEILSSAEKIYE